MKLFCVLAIANAVFAAEPNTATVTVPEGRFEFSSIQIFRRNEIGTSCGFIGRIENKTSTSWSGPLFSAKISGRDATGSPQSFAITVRTEDLSYGEFTWKVWGSCPEGQEEFQIERLSMELIGGLSLQDELTRERKAAAVAEARSRAKALAARKRAAEQQAARAAYLAKLPVLNNGTDVIFVGADKKCSQQFTEALSMDGLEKRKRIADLITYGCGFLVDAGTHIELVQREGSSALVRPAEGNQAGKSGWVPLSWVH